jgi:hypothetical protein
MKERERFRNVSSYNAGQLVEEDDIRWHRTDTTSC